MLEDLYVESALYLSIFYFVAEPPKPVANPIVPSVASTSTKKDPKTLIPQLVREALYFSHRDIGVEIDVSINQCPPLTL
jgi:hypothetical protein